MILVNGEQIRLKTQEEGLADDETIWEVSASQPEYRLTESDQTDPAGRWRWRLNGDVLYLERATSAEWAADEDWLTLDKGNELITFGKAVTFSSAAPYTFTDTSDAASVQVLVLDGDRATMADEDTAYVSLRMSDDGGTQTEVARISWTISDVTDTTEDGYLFFSTLNNTTLTEALRLSSTGVVIIGTGEGGTTAATGNTLRAPDLVTGGAGDVAGADLTYAVGLGTGTGDVGQHIFQTARVAAAGDNIQTLATFLTLDATAATFSSASSTGNTVLTVQNTTNDAEAAHAYLDLAVGGTTSTGDPHIRFTIPSGLSWIMGPDNSTSDWFFIGTGTDIGFTSASLFLRNETSGVTTLTRVALQPIAATLGNSSAAEMSALAVTAATATLAGTTTVNILWEWVRFLQLTIAQSGGAVTVNDVTGLSLIVPTMNTSVTGTDVSGLRILNAGTVNGTITNQYGIYIEAMTSGGSDYGIGIEDAATAGLWLSLNTDSTDAAGGILFGSSSDTNLYRSAANRLRTDDTFEAATALRLAAPNTVAGTGLMLTTNDGSIQEVMRDSSTISLKQGWKPILLAEARKLLQVTAGHYRMNGVPDSGFYVEEFESVGITDILSYVDGKPTAFKTFGRGITAYMLPLVQDHDARLDILEEAERIARDYWGRVETLEQENKELRADLEELKRKVEA